MGMKQAVDAGLGFYIFFFALTIVVATVVYAVMTGTVKVKKGKESRDSMNSAFMRTVRRFADLKGFEVLGRTTLSFNGEEFTFDAILLGFFGTIAIRANYAGGEVYGSYKDEKWCTVDENGKKTYFESPVTELAGSVRFFKDLYGAEKTKCGMADSFVVFAGRKTKLFADKRCNVYTMDNLNEKLTGDKYAKDNGADIEAMKAALAKYTVK
ncbi:MAG: hypothetical protein IKB62_06080 [Oscillospiraceae bacterium]|nr:hypothetical protein [Oscillospiraceae bacterium]